MFLLTPERFEALLPQGVPTATQEYQMLSPDFYAGVTTALYVTAEQLDDTAYMLKWLEAAIGLELPTPSRRE